MSCPTRKQHANHVMFEVTVLHFKQITYTHYQTELDLTGCFITLSDSQTSDSTQLRRFLIGYCVSTRQLGQKRGRLDAIYRGQSGPDRADWKKTILGEIDWQHMWCSQYVYILGKRSYLTQQSELHSRWCNLSYDQIMGP